MSIYPSSFEFGMDEILNNAGVIVGYAREIEVPANMITILVYDGNKNVSICVTKEMARKIATCIMDHADGKGW